MNFTFHDPIMTRIRATLPEELAPAFNEMKNLDKLEALLETGCPATMIPHPSGIDYEYGPRAPAGDIVLACISQDGRGLMSHGPIGDMIADAQQEVPAWMAATGVTDLHLLLIGSIMRATSNRDLVMEVLSAAAYHLSLRGVTDEKLRALPVVPLILCMFDGKRLLVTLHPIFEPSRIPVSA